MPSLVEEAVTRSPEVRQIALDALNRYGDLPITWTRPTGERVQTTLRQLLGIPSFNPIGYLQQFIGSVIGAHNGLQGVAASQSMGRTYDYDVRGPGAVWSSVGTEGTEGSQGLGLYNRDTSTQTLGFSGRY